MSREQTHRSWPPHFLPVLKFSSRYPILASITEPEDSLHRLQCLAAAWPPCRNEFRNRFIMTSDCDFLALSDAINKFRKLIFGLRKAYTTRFHSQSPLS
jgi:hypothetical protein